MKYRDKLVLRYSASRYITGIVRYFLFRASLSTGRQATQMLQSSAMLRPAVR